MSGVRATLGGFIGLILLAIFFLNWIKVLNEYERGVIFRLGKLLPYPKGPGLILVFSPIDRMVKMSLRLVALDVPPQDVITRDNVSVNVNAVIFFRVVHPIKAVVEVENFLHATSQLAQTTLRSVLGQVELDGLLSERERLNMQLQDILDKHTDPWGIKVTSVEVKHVDLPAEMTRAPGQAGGGGREKRAKIIHADGEFEASDKLARRRRSSANTRWGSSYAIYRLLPKSQPKRTRPSYSHLPIELMQEFLNRAKGGSS